MFDIGWSELLLIGIVALIVVGPKDLPVMFRTLGRLTAKARAMGREFSRAMEEAAHDSGLDSAARGLNEIKDVATSKNPGLAALERATERFEKWDPKMPSPGRAPHLDSDPELDDDLDADHHAAPVAPKAAPKADASKPDAPKGTA